mmetsp:Transcript_34205/g.54990  ORF Transcript_34205/g.54990 Transcript_34205/m.54990 type:complete len:1075 (+) Transcript_34205:3-3227(+)
MLYDRTSSENDAYALLKKELLANEELNPGSMHYAGSSSLDSSAVPAKKDKGDREQKKGLTPRSEYSEQKKKRLADILRIVMTIDDLMIARLKRKFLRLGRRGVDLPDFCTIFYDTLGMYFPLANKNEILSALMHVFEDIDIRGQKVIRWETLLDHLAEMAVQYHKMHGANLETKEYAPSEHVRDHSHHDNKIAFIQHYNTINKTVLLERGNPVIKLYDSETLSLDMTLKGHRRAVLCVDVVPANGNMLASSSRDKTIAFWDLSTQKMINEWKLSRAQICIRCIGGGQMASSDTSGKIFLWNMDRGRLLHQFHCHYKAVLDMVGLKDQGDYTLATCSQDGTIRLWDTHNMKEGPVLRNKEKNEGLALLAYSKLHGFLGTTDTTNYVWIWDLASKHIVAKLKVGESHTRTVGIDMGHGDEIICASNYGDFKVFSAKNFACIQKFQLLRMNGQLTAFTCDHTKGLILAADKHIHQYASNEIAKPNMAKTPLVFAMFNSSNLTFVTIENSTIKIWDALTGELDRTYFQVTRSCSPVTCACIDASMRRIFVGDHQGDIRIINYSNGAVMRDLDSHESEVSSLVHTVLDGQTVVLSGSWDMHVKKHLDKKNVKRSTLRHMKKHEQDIVEITASKSIQMIVSGSADGTACVYDDGLHFKMKLNYESIGKGRPITCLSFLGETGTLFIADQTGNLSLWDPKIGFLVCYWTNSKTDLHGNEEEGTSPVLCMAYDSATRSVYTGDTDGFVKKWAVATFLSAKRSVSPTEDENADGVSTPPCVEDKFDPSVKPQKAFLAHKRAVVLGIDTFRPSEKAQGHLLTWGSDGRVCIFDGKGVLVGLIRGETAEPGARVEWALDIDLNMRQTSERQQLENVVAEMDARAEFQRKKLNGELGSRPVSPVPGDATFLTNADVKLSDHDSKAAVKGRHGGLQRANDSFASTTTAVELRKGSKNRAAKMGGGSDALRTLKDRNKSPLKSKPYLSRILEKCLLSSTTSLDPQEILEKKTERKMVQVDGVRYVEAELSPRLDLKKAKSKNQRRKSARSPSMSSLDEMLQRHKMESPSHVFAVEQLDKALEDAFRMD